MKKAFWYLPVISLALFFSAWWIISLAVGSEFLFPSPSAVLEEMSGFLFSNDLIGSVFNTLYRVVVSFAAAFFIAFLFAMLAYKSIIAKKLLAPFVLLTRSTPTMSLIFICLIWFSSKFSPMAVSFAVLFPLLYSAFYGALLSVDKKIIEMAKAYKFSRMSVLKNVYVPYVAKTAYPQVVGALSFNVKLIVAGEAWAQTAESLGRVMYKANINLETARLFAATVAALVLSFVLELFIFIFKMILEKIRYAKVDKY